MEKRGQLSKNYYPAIIGIVIAFAIFLSFMVSGVVQTFVVNNDTDLAEIVTTTPVVHWLNLGNVSNVTQANVTTVFNSFSLGTLTVFCNNLRIGNITTTDTSPMTFTNVNTTSCMAVSAPINITYIPLIASTVTIDQTNISYQTNASLVTLNVSLISPNGNITTQNNSVNIIYNVTCDTGLNCINNFTFNGNNFVFDPVAFYNFNNFSALGENATYVVDVSGNNNNATVIKNGTISNTTLSTSIFGNAYNFYGNSNDSISALNYIQINNFPFTISGWINVSSNTTSQGVVMLFNATNNYYGFGIDVTGAIKTFSRNITSNPAGTFYGKINKSQWYHITVVFNNDSGRDVYINGLFVGTDSQVGGFTGKVRVVIGQVRPTSDYYNGTVDNVAIFNHTLNSTQVFALYNMNYTQFSISNSTLQFANNISDSLLNSTFTSKIYQYNLCLKNFSGSQVCLYNKITRIPIISNILSPFNSLIGVIGLYGTNLNNKLFLANGTMIDAQNINSRNTMSNLTWNRDYYSKSKMLSTRNDMILSDCYSNQTTRTDGVNFTCDLTNVTEFIQWAHQNNQRTLFIIDSMPSWLADNSSGFCTNLNNCPANNYTILGNIVVDYLNRVSLNGTYASDIDVEVWNEPDIGFLLGGLPTGNMQKSLSYNLIYNASYLAIKSQYPTIKVGGPVVSGLLTGANITLGFFTNFSNQMDFFSFHQYTNNAVSTYNTDFAQIQQNCSAYNANCNRILVSEWNVVSSSIQNGTLPNYPFASQIGLTYITFLKYSNLNITSFFYHWSERYHYGVFYPQYPNMYSMVSEPLLDNSTYPPFWVTSNFTRLCPSGGQVYISQINNSVDGLISNSSNQVVSCKNGNTYSAIIINTGNEAVNNTLNVSGTGITSMRDMQTGTNYAVTNGIANLGLSDSPNLAGGNGGIMYLSSDGNTPSLTINFPANTTYASIVSNISYTVSDDNLDTCKYSTNNWVTNTTVVCGNNITGLTASQGSNTWGVSANDTFGNLNMTSVTFSVDSLGPSISFDSSTASNGTTLFNPLYVGVTVTDGNFANTTINIYDSNSVLVSSTTGTTLVYNISATLTENALYFVNATAFDTFGNKNSTNTRQFTIIPVIPGLGGAPGAGAPTPGTTYTNALAYITIDTNTTWISNEYNDIVFRTFSTNNSLVEIGAPNLTFSNNISVQIKDYAHPSTGIYSTKIKSLNGTTPFVLTAVASDQYGVKSASVSIVLIELSHSRITGDSISDNLDNIIDWGKNNIYLLIVFAALAICGSIALTYAYRSKK